MSFSNPFTLLRIVVVVVLMVVAQWFASTNPMLAARLFAFLFVSSLVLCRYIMLELAKRQSAPGILSLQMTLAALRERLGAHILVREYQVLDIIHRGDAVHARLAGRLERSGELFHCRCTLSLDPRSKQLRPYTVFLRLSDWPSYDFVAQCRLLDTIDGPRACRVVFSPL